MNSKNNSAKNDLRFAYAQGNHSTYSKNVESMVRFLLSQYNIKTVSNLCNKKGNSNGKKGDGTKFEDKIPAT